MLLKFKLIFLSLLLACFSTFGQVITISPVEKSSPKEIYVAQKKTVLDTCVFRALYRMTFVRDVTNREKVKNHLLLLQIGKRISKFSDYNLIIADSLREEYAKQKMETDIVMSKIDPYLTGLIPLNIFKEYPTGKITQIDRLLTAGIFKYSENKTKQNWKMSPETLTIFGYPCKKATLAFRGRNYTAWYTPKIAYSEGPWKFWGLPGLILKVSDDKNEYLFECVGIEKARNNERIYIKKLDYFDTTREAFNKTAKSIYSNPGPLYENANATVNGKPMANKSIPFNPIELE